MATNIQGFEGNLIGATNRHMMRTLSLTQSAQADITLTQQRSYTYFDTQTATGGGDYFFYLLNGSQRDLLVTRVSIGGPTLESVRLQSVTGTAVGGTALAAANRTVGSGRVPDPTVDSQSGVNITGLTATNTFERLVCPANTSVTVELVDRPLIVRPNFAIALLADVGAIAITFAVDVMSQVIETAEII